jgi:hypothetical protein
MNLTPPVAKPVGVTEAKVAPLTLKSYNVYCESNRFSEPTHILSMVKHNKGCAKLLLNFRFESGN